MNPKYAWENIKKILRAAHNCTDEYVLNNLDLDDYMVECYFNRLEAYQIEQETKE